MFFQKNKKEPGPIKVEKIREEREKIIYGMRKTLESKGFTDMEVEEVINIIGASEGKIQILKDSLIGTNINQDPTEIQASTLAEINKINQEIPVQLHQKIQEIIQRRQ